MNAQPYIKQKLLKNAIWGRYFKILAKRKVICHFGLNIKLFKFARTMVANSFSSFHRTFTRFLVIINYLLTSLIRSVLVKYRSSVFLHGPRSVRTKNVGPIFHYYRPPAWTISSTYFIYDCIQNI